MPQANGSLIRRLREERDLSARDLASTVSVHEQSLRAIESGREPASVRLLGRITRALNDRAVELGLDATTYPSVVTDDLLAQDALT